MYVKVEFNRYAVNCKLKHWNRKNNKCWNFSQSTAAYNKYQNWFLLILAGNLLNIINILEYEILKFLLCSGASHCFYTIINKINNVLLGNQTRILGTMIKCSSGSAVSMIVFCYRSVILRIWFRFLVWAFFTLLVDNSKIHVYSVL